MARDLKVLDMAKWGRKFQPCLGLGYKLFKRTKVDESGEILCEGAGGVSVFVIKVNQVDAAIAEVQTGRVDPSGFILNMGEVSNAIAVPFLSMPVKKNGSTTNLTNGTITALDVTVDIEYDRQCGISIFPRTARFTGQIMIGPDNFSAAGDSGSLIVEDCSPFPRPAV